MGHSFGRMSRLRGAPFPPQRCAAPLGTLPCLRRTAAFLASHVTVKDWQQLRLTHWEEDILFSHAGWSRHHVPSKDGSLPDLLAHEESEAWKALIAERPHWVWQAGRNRGGAENVGGLLWCDFNEFEPIPGIQQVFGHTPKFSGGLRKGQGSLNWSIDTANTNGVRHYATIQDRTLTLFLMNGDVDPAWRKRILRAPPRSAPLLP